MRFQVTLSKRRTDELPVASPDPEASRMGRDRCHAAIYAYHGKGEDSVSFNQQEVAYLRSQGTGRLATVDRDGQPDAVPVALEFDGTYLWVGGGAGVTQTRKFRNVAAGNAKVALVVDDVPSLDPFIARGIRIYGHADQPFERVGMVGPGTFMRITPTRSWSWNLAGEPVGDSWYGTRRTDHDAAH